MGDASSSSIEEILGELAKEAPPMRSPFSPRKKRRRVLSTGRKSWELVFQGIKEARRAAMAKTTTGIVDQCRLAMRHLPLEGEQVFVDGPPVHGLLVAAAKRAEKEAPAVARGDGVAAARVAIAVDACYFAARTAAPLSAPSPLAYFKGTLEDDDDDNPLLAIFDLRAKEAEGFFRVDDGAEGADAAFASTPPPSSSLEREALVEMEACGMKGTDPVATPTLHAWRASTRDALAREYSFAVPSEAALDVIAGIGNGLIVECGAGTGYWARALRQRRGAVLKAVEAYDVAPPSLSSSSSKKTNAYHGPRSRTWTDVREGAASDVSLPRTGATLLVVYPPPDEPFLGALATRFAAASTTTTTNRLALVGEWRGDTALKECLDALTEAFVLEATHDLPNWGDTSANLTIWRPHRRDDDRKRCSLDSCSSCGKSVGENVLYRCRLTCDVWYCSRACAKADRPRHNGLVQAKCFFDAPDTETQWKNPKYWRRFDLTPQETTTTGSSGGKTKKKKKKKKQQQRRGKEKKKSE